MFLPFTFRSTAVVPGLTAAALAGAPALAQDSQAMIDSALSAAPPAIKQTATIRDLQGNVLRQGDGTYTCFPAPQGVAGPMCLDEEWLRWMDAWMSRNEDHQVERLGLAYMLAGDSPDGGASNIDPFATARSEDNQWVAEGPHVMVIVPDPAMLEGIGTDPGTGEPYVMWKGTPFAHVMMPVGARTE